MCKTSCRRAKIDAGADVVNEETVLRARNNALEEMNETQLMNEEPRVSIRISLRVQDSMYNIYIVK